MVREKMHSTNTSKINSHQSINQKIKKKLISQANEQHMYSM